jgi:hypothetical protein
LSRPEPDQRTVTLTLLVLVLPAASRAMTQTVFRT